MSFLRAKLSTPQKEDAATPKPETKVKLSSNFVLEAVHQDDDYYLGIQAERMGGVNEVYGVTPLNLLHPMDDYRNYLSEVLGKGCVSDWCSDRDTVLMKVAKKFLPAPVDNSKALEKALLLQILRKWLTSRWQFFFFL